MRKIIPILFVASILVAFWVRRVPPPPPTASSEPPSAVDRGSFLTVEPPRASVSPRAPDNAAKPVTALAPTLEKMRDEVTKNPHVPPPSLVAFSVALAPRLDEALKWPGKAEEFYGELRDCVEGPSQRGAKSIQALCLINLRRLGDKIPALRERARATWERADPELRRLAE